MIPYSWAFSFKKFFMEFNWVELYGNSLSCSEHVLIKWSFANLVLNFVPDSFILKTSVVLVPSWIVPDWVCQWENQLYILFLRRNIALDWYTGSSQFFVYICSQNYWHQIVQVRIVAQTSPINLGFLELHLAWLP